MLVLAPAACCLGGVAAHEFLLALTRAIRAPQPGPSAVADGSASLLDTPATPSPAPKSRGKGKSSAAKVQENPSLLALITHPAHIQDEFEVRYITRIGLAMIASCHLHIQKHHPSKNHSMIQRPVS